MVTKSDKLTAMIWDMKGIEREAAASLAVFCLSKDNIESVGYGSTTRIVGMSDPIMQMLKALGHAGGVSGEWVLCEALISRYNTRAVLLFRGTEEDVCSEIVKLVEVAKVQTT